MTWGRGKGIEPWKPRVCADCGRRHPSFNRDAGKPGTPWRCLTCDASAQPMPVSDLAAAPIEPVEDRQGALL